MTARRMRPRLAAGGTALLLLASACGGPAAAPDPPLPVGIPTVTVTMRDLAFEHPQEIPAGQVLFRVTNAGTTVHRMALLPLPEDLPPLLEQVRGTSRRAIPPYAGLPDRQPGQDGAFVAHLMPGRRYGFICFVIDAGGSHAARGMVSEFRAPPAARPSS